jgi:hypothetical protein
MKEEIKMTKTRWIGLSIGIVLILAAFGVMAWQSLALTSVQNVALAQAAATATPTTSPQQPNAAPTVTTSSIGSAFWTELASKLGVSADTLKADALQVRKDMLDQAVKDGRLTQAQADQLKQDLDADKLIAPIYIGGGSRGQFGPGFRGPGKGQPPAPGSPAPGSGQPPAPGSRGPNNAQPTTPNVRGRGPGFGVGFGTAELEAVAKVLNLSSSDLVTQLRAGKTLADIAKAQNVDQAVVKQAIIDARKAEIDRELADGLITQAQADTLKARLTLDNIDLTRTPFFGFH